MPYEFYKVIHLVSIMTLFTALGALLMYSMNGAAKSFVGKRWAMIFHGVALVLILVSGFGLMARIGLAQGSWPIWIYGKVAIWLAMGLTAALVLRVTRLARLNWLVVLGLGLAAALLANVKS